MQTQVGGFFLLMRVVKQLPLPGLEKQRSLQAGISFTNENFLSRRYACALL